MEKFSLNKINNLFGYNVILISGESCANCYNLVPTINNIMPRFKNVNFYNLEIEEKYFNFLKIMKVNTIPTILVIKDNELIGSCHGYQPDEILEIWLEDKLNFK